MPCYTPMKVWRSRYVNKKTGKRAITFKRSEAFTDLPLEIPCGQCIGCRLDKSRQWAIRCVHEASLYEENSFITLTYAPENLPKDRSINKETFKKFMKRYRKEIDKNDPGRKIRFMASGS